MTDQPRNYSVALIPGDGIGVEVVEAARQVLNAAAASSEVYTITYTKLLWDSTFYKEAGPFMLFDFKTVLQNSTLCYLAPSVYQVCLVVSSVSQEYSADIAHQI